MNEVVVRGSYLDLCVELQLEDSDDVEVASVSKRSISYAVIEGQASIVDVHDGNPTTDAHGNSDAQFRITEEGPFTIRACLDGDPLVYCDFVGTCIATKEDKVRHLNGDRPAKPRVAMPPLPVVAVAPKSTETFDLSGLLDDEEETTTNRPTIEVVRPANPTPSQQTALEDVDFLLRDTTTPMAPKQLDDLKALVSKIGESEGLTVVVTDSLPQQAEALTVVQPITGLEDTEVQVEEEPSQDTLDALNAMHGKVTDEPASVLTPVPSLDDLAAHARPTVVSPAPTADANEVMVSANLPAFTNVAQAQHEEETTDQVTLLTPRRAASSWMYAAGIAAALAIVAIVGARHSSQQVQEASVMAEAPTTQVEATNVRTASAPRAAANDTSCVNTVEINARGGYDFHCR